VERFFAYPFRAGTIGAALLLAVGIAAILIPTGPLAVDRHWSDAMEDIRTPFLDHVAHVFNWLGRGVGSVAVVAAVAILLLLARRGLALVAWLLAELLAAFSTSALKALTERPRPPHGLVHAGSWSFPSGHTSYAAVTAVGLVLLFTVPGRRAWWWVLAALATAAMAWSRTYLQVHWLSDVVAGALLGAGMAAVVFAATQLWPDRRVRGGLPSMSPLQSTRRRGSGRR
jgi:membrane-associated phospholipid phosphatase